MGFMFAVESNRLVSEKKGEWIQVQKLDMPKDGKLVWLKKFGYVRLFRKHLKEQVRHYVVYIPGDDQNEKNLRI